MPGKDWQTEIEDPTLATLSGAVDDVMGDVRDKGSADSTPDNYTTLMDQLQASRRHTRIQYIQHFGQDEMEQFRRDREDENASWKRNRLNDQ